MGKAMLAFSGRDLARCVDALGDLHRFTDHTITNRPRLVADLETPVSAYLKLRGEGEVLGTRQSGLAAFRLARPRSRFRSLAGQVCGTGYASQASTPIPRMSSRIPAGVSA